MTVAPHRERLRIAANLRALPARALDAEADQAQAVTADSLIEAAQPHGRELDDVTHRQEYLSP